MESFGYIPKKGIAGLLGRPSFSLVSNLHTDLHGGSISSYSQKK